MIRLHKLPKSIFRLQTLLTLSVVLSVPLLFSGITISTILVKGLVMNVLLACLLGSVYFRLGLEGGAMPFRTALLKPASFYLAWMLLSAVFAVSSPDKNAFLIQTVLLVFFAHFVALHGKEDRLYLRIIAVLLAVGGLTSIYAIFQIFGWDFFPWWRFEWSFPVRRVCSSFGNPTFFAGYLIAIIPLTLAVWSAARRPIHRCLLVLLIAIEILALGLTFSKGGLMGLVVGVAAWIFLRRKQLRVDRRAVKIGVSGILLLAVLLGFVCLSSEKGKIVAGKLIETVRVSSEGRLQMYKSTFKMIVHHPLLGVGPGLYGRSLPDYRTPELTLFHPPHLSLLSHAHSEYLEQAAELGLPGLFLFLWILFVALRCGISRGEKTELQYALAAGVVAGLVAVLVQDLSTVNLRKVPTMLNLWTFIGLAVCLDTPSPSGSRRRPPILPVKILAGGVGLLIAMSVCYVQARDLIVDIYLRNGGAQLKEKRSGDAGPLLSRAIRLDPGRAEGYYWLGSLYYESGDFPRAIEQFEKVLALQGNYVNTIFNLGTSYARAGNPQKAVELYTKGLKSDPYYAKMHDYLGRCYLLDSSNPNGKELATQCFELAVQYYAEQIRRNPTKADLHIDRGKVFLLLQKPDQARPEFESALQLDPKSTEAKALLDKTS